MLNNFRNLRSLFGSHGSQWLLFRISYVLRKRTGYIRLQMPQYQWKDRPLSIWLKKGIPSTAQQYREWRKQNSPRFFPGAPEERRDNSGRNDSGDEAPWNPQTAID